MMEVRFARRDDIAPLLRLYRHLNADDVETALEDGLESWARLTRMAGSGILIGCVGEEIVASCTLVVIPNLTRGGAPYALIENVVTHADYRKHGYGTAVLHAAAEAAWQAGCYKLMLLTGSKDPATLKFYHDAGFEQSKTGFQMRRVPPRDS